MRSFPWTKKRPPRVSKNKPHFQNCKMFRSISKQSKNNLPQEQEIDIYAGFDIDSDFEYQVEQKSQEIMVLTTKRNVSFSDRHSSPPQSPQNKRVLSKTLSELSTSERKSLTHKSAQLLGLDIEGRVLETPTRKKSFFQLRRFSAKAR
uniref:Uncharacterized protein n=1 Tax=Mucochytrium quahogii TaxID=96639 RepID=A0A7S2SL14_9STRA|mmetsp:Transcript_8775/g.16359  ORF Transcript_8775/g.16359 Transcript_8775/m.16359 type:complete len:148 (-) Transcript_8775:1451-1894(-)